MKLSWLSRPAILCLCIALWMTTACRNGSPSITSLDQRSRRERVLGKRGGVLKVRVNSPPQTFNYLNATDEPSVIVAFYLMGGRLVEFDHDGGKYVPSIAEEW